jgi:hypothetical protein
MRKIILIIGLITSLTTTLVSAEAETSTDKTTQPLTHWLSKNVDDPISIQNGAGIQLNIPITVDKGGAGVTVKNCGTTTHIDAGSSTMCSTNDSKNPVTLTSDSGTVAATGTYQMNVVKTTP